MFDYLELYREARECFTSLQILENMKFAIIFVFKMLECVLGHNGYINKYRIYYEKTQMHLFIFYVNEVKNPPFSQTLHVIKHVYNKGYISFIIKI